MAKLGLDYPTKWGRTPATRAVRNLIHGSFLVPYTRYLSTLDIRGTEKIQGDGPFIFVANHTSNMDTPLVIAALPVQMAAPVLAIATRTSPINATYTAAVEEDDCVLGDLCDAFFNWPPGVSIFRSTSLMKKMRSPKLQPAQARKRSRLHGIRSRARYHRRQRLIARASETTQVAPSNHPFRIPL